MDRLREFSSAMFEWSNGRGVSYMSDLRLDHSTFPYKGFGIRSAKSGKVVRFLPDRKDMVDHDFYDGECYTFIGDSSIRVAIWMG